MTNNGPSQPRRVFIKTFGCQMNEYDSQRMLGMLEENGFVVAQSSSQADCILLNTCTVRQKAEDKVYSELGRLKQLKQQRPTLIIGVGGCLGQQEGDALIKRYPYVDLVFGTHALERLPQLIDEAGSRHTVCTKMHSRRSAYPDSGYRFDTGGYSAYLSIMQGCNNYCAYCIVPYVRGPEWSRPPADIMSEAVRLAECGVREITLLGQNVNSYGATLTPAVSFPDLLAQLSAVEGLDRLRFTTSHPKDLSDSLIEAFAQLDKLCSHIHLPLQSGSDTVLARMNRRYTAEDYIARIQRLRRAVPDISITSDIIVGFPGETESDFNDTVRAVRTIGFDDLFIFHYTDRRGTRAAGFSDKVPYAVRIDRLKRLNHLQHEISLEKNRQLIGTCQEVLFEGLSKKSDGFIAGRSAANKVVNCRGSADMLGRIRRVTITAAHVHSLSGELCTDRAADNCASAQP